MKPTQPKHRAAARALLDPGELLVALTCVASGTNMGQVGGRDTTLHGVSDYLREHGLTALGIPADRLGEPAHAFGSGWLVATDRRVAFVVRGFWSARPKAIAYDLPFERVELRWRDAASLRLQTRLYHLIYTHTNGNRMDLVRRGLADADGEAFVAAFGDRARPV